MVDYITCRLFVKAIFMQSDDKTNHDVIVIQGIRQGGEKLRPGDWAERISSTLACFDYDQRLKYSQCVKPCIVSGEKCLVVARGLEQSNPKAYEFIMHFASANQLCTFEDRRTGNRALVV